MTVQPTRIKRRLKISRGSALLIGVILFGSMMTVGSLIMIKGGSPGMHIPSELEERIAAETAAKSTLDRKTRDLNEEMLRAEFNTEVLKQPGSIQTTIAMHSRKRRGDVLAQIDNPKSLWYGYSYDTVAMAAIRNNFERIEATIYTNNNVKVSYKDHMGKEHSYSSTPEMYIALLLLDINALIGTMSNSSDANLKVASISPRLDSAIEDFRQAKINHLNSQRLYNDADELRSLDKIIERINDLKNKNK